MTIVIITFLANYYNYNKGFFKLEYNISHNNGLYEHIPSAIVFLRLLYIELSVLEHCHHSGQTFCLRGGREQSVRPVRLEI